MGASQLSVYNKALRHLEERQLANLTENREPRRLLDAEWSDAILTVLQAAYWKHAMRTVKASPDTSSATNFGRKYVFTKPADWVRTYQISPDDRFMTFDKQFRDENGRWFSDAPFFYARYVSSDSNYGWNLSLWAPAFTEYAAVYLAWTCAPRLKQASDKVDMIAKTMKRLKSQAMAIDAMDEPPGEIPLGTWVQSRQPRGSMYPGYDWHD